MNYLGEYKEFRDSIKEDLSNALTYYLSIDDIDKASDILYKMIRYKLIDKSDFRIKQVVKSSNIDLDKRNMINNRIKNYSQTVPESLLMEYRPSGIKILCHSYLAEHLEGSKKIDVVIDRKYFNAIIRTVNDGVNRVLSDIKSFCDSHGLNLSINKLKNEVEVGYNVLGVISIEDTFFPRYRDLGYIMFRPDIYNNVINVFVMLKYNIFIKFYIDLYDALYSIRHAIYNNIGTNYSLKVQFLGKWGTYIEKQNNMIKESNNRLYDYMNELRKLSNA